MFLFGVDRNDQNTGKSIAKISIPRQVVNKNYPAWQRKEKPAIIERKLGFYENNYRFFMFTIWFGKQNGIGAIRKIAILVMQQIPWGYLIC